MNFISNRFLHTAVITSSCEAKHKRLHLQTFIYTVAQSYLENIHFIDSKEHSTLSSSSIPEKHIIHITFNKQ